MVKRFILTSLVLVVICGCYYSVYSNAYPHLKKIRLEPFENQTAEFGLSDKALSELSTSVRNDGRLKMVTQEPDCSLEGSITAFDEKIYSYTEANQVQDYQLTMTVDVVFTDLSKNEVIYENKSLRLNELYKVSDDSTARFETKDEALTEIFADLFKMVIRNSLEAW